MKIALVCTGLGHVWRGYERFTRDLFDLIKDDLDITLFKGDGPSGPRERKLPHFNHDGLFSKFPNPYFYQHLSYALFLVPQLKIHHYTLVHYSEPGLGNILYHAKKRLGLSATLLFSNGVGLSADHCQRIDYVHQLTDVIYQDALHYGLKEDRMTSLPYGAHSKAFTPTPDRAPLRATYGIPLDKTVILSVAAMNRGHKRIDYLIEEAARLPDSFFLVLCGNLEDPSLKSLAEKRLPNRHKFLTLPFERIPDVYRLADIFAHTALEEGFCLALVEAMMANLPLVAHRSAHFRWLVDSDFPLVDLSQPGALSERLRNLPAQRTALLPMLRDTRDKAIQRFDWANLKARYLRMYDLLR